MLFVLVVLAGLPCSGCGWLRRHRDEPAEDSAQPAPVPIGLDHSRALFRGRIDGILLAANTGLVCLKSPPNSLASVQAAIDLGLPMVVVDVCQTADGVCVLNLDHSVTRPASTRPPSTGATSQRADGRLPRLSDVLSLARGKILLGLRLQSADLSHVVDEIDKTDLAEQVVVLLTTSAQVRQARPYLQRQPPILMGFDALTPERLARLESTPPWPALVQLGPLTLSPASIARVHAMGARVMVHQRGVLLVRVGSDLAPYHRMGVSVILTDWPRHLLAEMQAINRSAAAPAATAPAPP